MFHDRGAQRRAVEFIGRIRIVLLLCVATVGCERISVVSDPWFTDEAVEWYEFGYDVHWPKRGHAEVLPKVREEALRLLREVEYVSISVRQAERLTGHAKWREPVYLVRALYTWRQDEGGEGVGFSVYEKDGKVIVSHTAMGSMPVWSLNRTALVVEAGTRIDDVAVTCHLVQ